MEISYWAATKAKNIGSKPVEPKTKQLSLKNHKIQKFLRPIKLKLKISYEYIFPFEITQYKMDKSI